MIPIPLKIVALALHCHHIITDHLTLEMIADEIGHVLKDTGDALSTPLPYRDFVASIRPERLKDHEAYFRRRLADVDQSTAVFDRLDVHVAAALEEVCLRLDAKTAQHLRTCARAQGVSPAVLMHIVWANVIAHCAGRDDVVFGTTLSGRLQGAPRADSAFGLFINTLPIRIALNGRTVRELVHETFQQLSNCWNASKRRSHWRNAAAVSPRPRLCLRAYSTIVTLTRMPSLRGLALSYCKPRSELTTRSPYRWMIWAKSLR